MYTTNVIEYDNMTDHYNDSLPLNNNCTINEKIIDIFIPTIIPKVPCGPSFLCLISFMA